MDIEMTFMDGMSAAEEIRRADPEVLIIFITNSPQYAIKGYAVQALDYILKPLSYYAFCQRMNHVRELLGRRQKHFLTVPCAGGVQKLDASDIYYVEICDHDLLFHTKQGEVHSTGSMRDVEQKLPPENFFRSSKAYLVNLEHVDGIQDEDAIVNGDRVQISRAKRKAFWRRSITTWGKTSDASGNSGQHSPPVYRAGGLACLPFVSVLSAQAYSRLAAVYDPRGVLLLLGVFMQATGQVPQFWFLPCIAVSILIMYLYIRMQTDVPARCAGYYCVRAFILGELAASLEWQLYYYMVGQHGTPGAGVRVCILAVVYAAVYGVVFAQERNYNDIASPLHVHKKEFLSTLFIGVAVYATSNLSYVSPDTPFSGKVTAEIYNIRTLVDLGGMAILFAHHMQLVEYRRKKERDALQNVLQAQYAQYRSAQDSIDLINKNITTSSTRLLCCAARPQRKSPLSRRDGAGDPQL